MVLIYYVFDLTIERIVKGSTQMFFSIIIFSNIVLEQCKILLVSIVIILKIKSYPKFSEKPEKGPFSL